jgi:thiamine-monophosphate kinase
MPIAAEEPGNEGGAGGEFDWIEQLLRPLTRGAPGALGLLDDAAFLRPAAGQDLVLTKDAMVAGVHFLPGDPLDGVARKLLAVNLSDLAAKGASPVGYLLSTAWPRSATWSDKQLFARGLAQAGQDWNLDLLGGDTVSTPGPLTLTATLLGIVPTGRMVLRSGARPRDLLLVSGAIGDGWLGLKAARGEIADPDGSLSLRYRRPAPRLALGPVLRAFAGAAADVSDGLLADAGRLAIASGCAVEVDLDLVPLSAGGGRWLLEQPGADLGRLALATGGDDYEVVCAVRPDQVLAIQDEARAAGLALTVIGRFAQGTGVTALASGRPMPLDRLGWDHGA